MSNLNALALIIATFISGTFLMAYLTKLQNKAAAEIIVGMLLGVHLTTEVRWIWLFQVFLGMAVAVLVTDFFLMFAFLRIAANVEDGLQILAYLGAATTGFGFVVQLLFGTSAFLKLVSMLRQEQSS